MHTPAWLLLRRGGLRGKAPYFSDVISGGDGTPPAPASVQTRAFPQAPLQEAAPPSVKDAASRRWVLRVVEVVNNAMRGKLNVVLPVTLTPDSSVTTVADVRIGAASALIPSPLTVNAALEMASGAFYVSSQNDGSAVLAHTNNSQTDRSFNLVILG